ncbi:MAG: hypothetical protein AAF310_05895, partial [Myxococcota bacterium]
MIYLKIVCVIGIVALSGCTAPSSSVFGCEAQKNPTACAVAQSANGQQCQWNGSNCIEAVAGCKAQTDPTACAAAESISGGRCEWNRSAGLCTDSLAQA